MSQTFSTDAQMSTTATSLVTTTNTAIIQTNFLRGPFLNCKVCVRGVALITIGTGATSVQVKVSRNPSAENLILNPVVQSFTVTAGNTIAIPFFFTDQVPDGRDCQYLLFIQQVAATGNGSALAGTYIEAQVISG